MKNISSKTDKRGSLLFTLTILALVIFSIAIPILVIHILGSDKGKTSNGIRFTIASDGKSVTITGYEGKAEAIDIPEQIKGFPVRSIGFGAFDHCATLTSITIPSSVTTIGDEAFIHCYNLTSIEIPSSVTAIGDMVFYSCLRLTNIEIPPSVTSIGERAFNDCRSLANIEIPSSITSIGWSAFWHCAGLTDITIPSSVTSIKSEAFSNCRSLTSITVDSQNPAYASIDGVLFDKTIQTIIAYPNGKEENSYTIPSSVTAIGVHVFSYSDRLTNITIPFSVTSIGEKAFLDCKRLTSITVDSQNPAFASIDGVLFDKTIQTIIAYPDGKSAGTYIIPSSVTAIGGWAFWNNAGLTRMVIPSSVMSIGDAAFRLCNYLNSITLSRHTQVEELSFPYSAQINYFD
jgi:hypothetical protein